MQAVPEDVTHAVAEVRLADSVVADLVLYRGATPAAAIEVFVTSRVGQEKARRFPIPWVELRAEDVLDRPYWWVAIQDGLQHFQCPACEERAETRLTEVREIQGRAVRIAEREDLPLPPSPPYRYVAHECWRCGEEMVAFLWPGGGGHTQQRPPAPIPATVRYRFTDGAGDYWANCCPRCSGVQGDYYLVRDNTDFATVREVMDDPYIASG